MNSHLLIPGSHVVVNHAIKRNSVAGHLQRGSAIRWREDIETDVAKISGGASNLAGYTKT